MVVTVTAINGTHLTISGALTVGIAFLMYNFRFLRISFWTTNIIMANWPRAMWQSVVDRAVRILASSPFGSHFFSVRTTVGGN
ncbi:hypothetical protein KIN20_017349 [Parelaphostrongylus tenuis]|uniref:Uncharacterized protein n=1 Tax=Parelaphostrongylus tenuis TaxID=148309 RepID=A0AAD5MZT7_PARTN|nr:hypothetical protein KIN20_017349 [Parelaphostrongylus tenuis]